MKRSVVAIALSLCAFSAFACNNQSDCDAATDALIMKFTQPINQWDSYVSDINAEASRLGLHFTSGEVDLWRAKINNVGDTMMKRSLIAGLVATSVVVPAHSDVKPVYADDFYQMSSGEWHVEFAVNDLTGNNLAKNGVTVPANAFPNGKPTLEDVNRYLNTNIPLDTSRVDLARFTRWYVPDVAGSAYFLAENNEHRITNLENQTSTPVAGQQGEKGDKGDKGDTGANGADGKDGKDGIDGIDGKDGKDGKDGAAGKDGVDGVTTTITTTDNTALEGEKTERATQDRVITDRVRANEGRVAVNTQSIAENKTNIAVNTGAIAVHEQKIDANEQNIAVNKVELINQGSQVAQNTRDIGDNKTTIATVQTDVQTKTTENKELIDKNSLKLDDHEQRIAQNTSNLNAMASTAHRNDEAIAEANSRSKVNSERLTHVESHQQQQDKRIDENHKQAMAGVASALAMSGLHYTADDNSLAIGAGSYGGGNATAIGYQHTSGHVRYSAQASIDTTGEAGVAGSVAIGW